MENNVMKTWFASSHLTGSNASYVEALYEIYLQDPDKVAAVWQAVFKDLPATNNNNEQPHSVVRDYFRQLSAQPSYSSLPATAAALDAKQAKVLQLIDAYRVRGHQEADLDPLGLATCDPVPELDPAFHQLAPQDLQQYFQLDTFAGGNQSIKLNELLTALRRTYCGAIGAEFMHITSSEEKLWVQTRLESALGQPDFSPQQKRTFLEELTAAEGLERYIGAKFPGAKRFSLEGGDALIPMLKELIRHAGAQGVKQAVIGMAHRGRLNVLVNVLGKKPSELFDEFSGKHDGLWGTGDVKYHQGFSSDFATIKGNVHLALAFNPSHLEIVNPVVMGSVRARQDRLSDQSGDLVLPITIHGDSAIAGQGVVQETFNMSKARGFQVGGTVRIVINNQVGFTTSNPMDTRSTAYCTDIAKMVQAPIFHVNADNPEAVAFVVQLAFDFRQRFKRDVVIDLVCYRRHGHNEADEPNATQPLMYQRIKKHPTPRKLYADILVAQGIVAEQQPSLLVNAYRDALDSGNCVVKEFRPVQTDTVNWAAYLNRDWTTAWQSELTVEQLMALGQQVSRYPASHTLHNRVDKIYAERRKMANGEKPLDWGMAETLAYATLLDQGKRIRITGQDSGRGTFFHRHAVLHDQQDASLYVPLCHLHDQQGPFQIYDSVLSEEAVLAFEYGYATTEPSGLTIWEAQFGDFANGAQVVIDQFISSGEQKWGRMCGITMLLPHGYEGQGPEHSSARLERFLQLCAEQNMQICVPSTPAQIYHMLRRQVLRPMRRPLIVMSPKSLLRHPLCTSSLAELANGTFQTVIDEIDDLPTAEVKRVILCSGKVYYDLLEARRANGLQESAIVRIEQLYPFPAEQVAAAVAVYVNAVDFVWCQEEPQNQGAWYSSHHHFVAALPAKAVLRYAGREPSASPAVGYISLHIKQQQALINDALAIGQ